MSISELAWPLALLLMTPAILLYLHSMTRLLHQQRLERERVARETEAEKAVIRADALAACTAEVAKLRDQYAAHQTHIENLQMKTGLRK